MNRQDDRVISFDTSVNWPGAPACEACPWQLRKGGDTIDQHQTAGASTAEIMSAERVEAAGESNLFSDGRRLTQRIKNRV